MRKQAKTKFSVCRVIRNNGDVLLTKDHAHYYQVQMQMEVVKQNIVILLCGIMISYCANVSPMMNNLSKLNWTVWKSSLKKCLLPERIAKWFKKPELSANDDSDVDPPSCPSDTPAPSIFIDPPELVDKNSNSVNTHDSNDNESTQEIDSGDTGTTNYGVELWCKMKVLYRLFDWMQ